MSSQTIPKTGFVFAEWVIYNYFPKINNTLFAPHVFQICAYECEVRACPGGNITCELTTETEFALCSMANLEECPFGQGRAK